MKQRAWILLLAVFLIDVAVFRPGIPIDLNSDSLYLDDLWLSLTQGQGLRHWYLPPAPSFFPDLPLLALFTWAPSLAVRHGLYGAGYLLLLAMTMAWVGRCRFSLALEDALVRGLLGSLLLAAGLAWAPGLHDLLRPAHHGSLLLGAMILLCLAPVGESEPSRRSSIAAFVLTALLGFSDRLFIVWGVLPLLLVQASQPRLFWRPARLAWWSWVAAGFLLAEGMLFNFRGMEPPAIPVVRWNYWITWVGRDLLAQVTQLGELIWGSTLLGFLGLAWLAWRAVRLRWPGGEEDPAREALAYTGMSAISALMAAFALGNAIGRYSYPFFVMPALMLPLVLPRRWSASLTLLLAALLILAAFSRAALNGSLRAWPWKEPPDVLLLDVTLPGKGWRVGAADYWQARRLRLTAASQPKLMPIVLRPEAGGLHPYLWIVDASIFMDEGKQPDIDFVVTDGLDQAALRKVLGAPKRMAKVDGHELWIYR